MKQYCSCQFICAFSSGTNSNQMRSIPVSIQTFEKRVGFMDLIFHVSRQEMTSTILYHIHKEWKKLMFKLICLIVTVIIVRDNFIETGCNICLILCTDEFNNFWSLIPLLWFSAPNDVQDNIFSIYTVFVPW